MVEPLRFDLFHNGFSQVILISTKSKKIVAVEDLVKEDSKSPYI